MAFTALDALREGYEVYPVVDAIGGTSPEAHRAGLDRVMSRSVSSAFGASPRKASRRPSPASVDFATSPSVPMAASSTSQAPSGGSPSSVRAVSVASLVFPEPHYPPDRRPAWPHQATVRGPRAAAVPAADRSQCGPAR
jgi:hypothetical protein